MSFGPALVLAVLVHVGLFMLCVRLSSRAPQSHRVDVPETLFEVEVAHDAPPPEEPPEPPRTATASEPRTEPTEARATPVRRQSASPSAAPEASSVVAVEPGGPAAGAWVLHVTADPAARGGVPGEALGRLALDGTNHFMGTRETPADEARAAREQANAAAGAAMRDALHDHDTAIGLGGGGPVVTALESVVRESLAPVESHGILIAIADESGTVLRVDVESSSDAAAFRTIADDVLKRLRTQKVRMPAGSHGLAMRIDVASKMAMPSGGGIGLDPKSAGGHFDISDVGARPRRVIHARVLAEQVL